jgi:ATP adenylyltransferase/5',5'''-P-1,P-4-tetraphosphate phosphorylase II
MTSNDNPGTNKIILPGTFINQAAGSGNFADVIKYLLENQKKEWGKLAEGYETLNSVKVKSFQFDGFKIKVQYNPGRFTSSSAKVDPGSIKERKCFLCIPNLPEEQRGVKYGDDFIVLVNPFPIFPEHFTIAHLNHIPQQISGWFGKMLSLSKDLSKFYTVIYNGPKCGASAPDHLHFQAGNKFFMTVDNEFHLIKNEYGETVFENDLLAVTGVDDSLRRFIAIETSQMETAEKVFGLFYDIYSKAVSYNEEPMMNILSFYEEEYGWRIIIYLREKHRSSHFFKEGDDKILLSPAAVDLGGVCITPLEKDFNRTDKELVTEIFREVSLRKEQFDYIKLQLRNSLKSIIK